MKACAHCLKTFEPISSMANKQRYCSQICNNRAWRKRHNLASKGPRTIPCRSCKEPFTTSNARYALCSRACRLADKRYSFKTKYSKPKGALVYCIECLTEFKRDNKRRRFCGQECRDIGETKWRLRQKYREGKRLLRYCTWCGANAKKIRTSKAMAFCNQQEEALAKWWLTRIEEETLLIRNGRGKHS